MLRPTTSVAAALLLWGCGSAHPAEAPAPPAAAVSDADWIVLFDGQTLDGWHGYNRDDVPRGWTVEDGAIRFTPGVEGGDLMAAGVYGDFELELEWKVADCGNSGIFYHVEASPEHDAPWRTGLEMQVLDDTCHPDGKYPSHRAGALYDLYVPTEAAVRPAGEWNAARIVSDDGRIEHWLNGQQIVDTQMDTPEWDARIAASKFRDGDTFPAYGTRRQGAIGVQDHGDGVWYRNIRLRRL